MPFNQAVNVLKRQDRVIKGVQVWYSDQVSLKLLRPRKKNCFPSGHPTDSVKIGQTFKGYSI
jgi:hypothetical protein